MARIGVFVDLQNWMGRVSASTSISLVLINVGCIEYATTLVTNTLKIYCRQGFKISFWVFQPGLASYESIGLGGVKQHVYMIDGNTYEIDTPTFKFSHDYGISAHIASHFDITIDISSKIEIRITRGSYQKTRIISNPGIVFDGSYEDALKSLSEVLKIRKILLDAGL